MSETLFPPRPFWFADEELLTNVLRKEVNAVKLLLGKYPDLRGLFDAPAATVPQRKACFMVLAHRKIMDIIYEAFTGLYRECPSVGDQESNVISATQNLVAGDAPAWVLETNDVVERLPTRIFEALPDALRIQGFDPDNSTQVEAINSAAKALSSADQIQRLTRGVIEKQLRRLERRWSMEGSKSRLKDTEGLGPKKVDLSRYMDRMTEKQRRAYSLRFEYGLGLAKIALRMGIDRKTVDEHIRLAQKKVDQAYSGLKRESGRARETPEF